MFVDKQKLEKQHMEELTKICNLFDTLGIKHCVIGGYGLLAHGIRTSNLQNGIIIADSNEKEKMLEVLFKMNYTIYFLSDELIRAKKTFPVGDVKIDVVLGKIEGKTFTFNYNEKQFVFSTGIFSKETKEVYDSRKGKGVFRPLPLEEIYLLKMGGDEKDLLDLDIIKGSGKLDIDRLFKLFKKNKML